MMDVDGQRPGDGRGNLVDVWLPDDEFWMLLTGVATAPDYGYRDRVSPRWVGCASFQPG